MNYEQIQDMIIENLKGNIEYIELNKKYSELFNKLRANISIEFKQILNELDVVSNSITNIEMKEAVNISSNCY